MRGHSEGTQCSRQPIAVAQHSAIPALVVEAIRGLKEGRKGIP